MSEKKIIILGAGLAGLSAAWHLKKRGIGSAVFEKEDIVGGLCRSKRAGNFVFDYCGHLLHFRNSYALKLVGSLLNGHLARHERNAWVNSFGIFIRYPFQANLCALPREIAVECFLEFIRASKLPRAGNSQANFLKWINSTFGKGIARHFMVPYNKKFWLASLSRMSCPWSDKFIPQPGISDIINAFFTEDRNRFGYSATFWYPVKGGIDQLPRIFEKQIGGISKGCYISVIDLKRKEITIKGVGRERFDTLISTIPLPELIKIANPLPGKIISSLKKLRWNSIFNLNLGVEGSCQDNKHWVYFPQKETIFFRVGFFHNFSGNNAPSGKSSLYAEVSYSKNRPINRKKIVKQVLKDLHRSGILSEKNRVLVLDANDIKYGYPIYDRHYNRATEAIKEFLSANNIIVCGRYGSWEYMSMEDTILDGKRAASQIKP